MSESDMRGSVIQALKPLDAIPVENPACPGTPDVDFIGGRMELKWLRSKPKGAASPVVFRHYSSQQRLWAIRRRKAGGDVWLMIQCRREWLLFDAGEAAFFMNQVCWDELVDNAVGYWKNGLKDEELIECISRSQNVFTFGVDDFARLKGKLPPATTFR